MTRCQSAGNGQAVGVGDGVTVGVGLIANVTDGGT